MISRPEIIVAPASEYWKRIRLFTTLGRAMEVSFISEDNTRRHVADARISFIDKSDRKTKYPIHNMEIVLPHLEEKERTSRIQISNAQSLYPPLRRSSFSETYSSFPAAISVKEGDIIMAESDGRPIWLREQGAETITEVVSIHLEELQEEELLKERWCEGNSFSLLPLIHFVRTVLERHGFVPPAPRATFIIDDVNLRAFSYGCVHIPTMIQLAEKYNFHFVLATIPFDLRWNSKKVMQFVKERNKRISLAIHGNNHHRSELNRGKSKEYALMSMAQAIRRTERFEKRYGLPISRILIPPFGIYSDNIVRVLRSLEVEAICASHPGPWSPGQKASHNSRENRLQRWFPADFFEGMPILHRRLTIKDVSLDLFLGQPLIIYFHHDDFKEGYERICDMAAFINRLDDIHWCSLRQIGESNYEVRHEKNSLRVRAFSRRFNILIPDGTDHLSIELPDTTDIVQGTTVNANDRSYEMNIKERVSEPPPIPVKAGAMFNFTIRDPLPNDPRNIQTPPISLYSPIRRIMTEARDRGLSLVYKIKKRR
jgi:hypothetical protein